MGPSRADEDLSASFVSDDEQRRLEFDYDLAGYVRGHRERWDITAVLEPLQLLGAKTGQVQVHLHSSPLGRLAVTIQFELQPVACGRRAGCRASSAAVTC
jgi:hypothetical protein